MNDEKRCLYFCSPSCVECICPSADDPSIETCGECFLNTGCSDCALSAENFKYCPWKLEGLDDAKQTAETQD